MHFPHQEFFRLSLDDAWLPVAGYPPGIWYQELAGRLDMHGLRCRLVRFDAGSFTTQPVIHDTAEMVLIFSGDLVAGCAADGTGGETFTAPTCANLRHPSGAGCAWTICIPARVRNAGGACATVNECNIIYNHDFLS